MIITQLPQRLEIAFWVAFIPLMQKHPGLGFILHKAYMAIERIKGMSPLGRLLALSTMGLFIGFLLGYAAVSLALA